MSTNSTDYTYARFSHSVAAAMVNEKWTASPAHGSASDIGCPFILTRRDGLQLFFAPFAAYSRKGMGYASYNRPRDAKGKHVEVYGTTIGARLTDPSIKFSLSKTAEQVARDIQRRLVPEAEKLHQEVLRRIESENAYHDRAASAAEVAKTLTRRAGLRFSANGADIEVCGYVSPETAKKIHALLADVGENE